MFAPGLNQTNRLVAGHNTEQEYEGSLLWAGNGRQHEPAERLKLPQCCTYNQVYERLINLLNNTSQQDPQLMEAYLDELQVS